MYLAQLMGPVLFIVGLSFALNGQDLLAWFKKLDKAGHSLFLQGIVETTVGLAIITAHNYWVTPAEIIISFMGWAMLFEGTLALITSKTTVKKMVRNWAKPDFMVIWAFISLVLGAYLTWVGYFA